MASPPTTAGRRLRRVELHPALLPIALSGGSARAVWVANPLPTGARPIYQAINDGGFLVLFFEDPSFEAVPIGELPPLHQLDIQVRPAPPDPPPAPGPPPPEAPRGPHWRAAIGAPHPN